MVRDGYLTKVNGGYDKYPPRALKNGFNVDDVAALPQGFPEAELSQAVQGSETFEDLASHL